MENTQAFWGVILYQYYADLDALIERIEYRDDLIDRIKKEKDVDKIDEMKEILHKFNSFHLIVAAMNAIPIFLVKYGMSKEHTDHLEFLLSSHGKYSLRSFLKGIDRKKEELGEKKWKELLDIIFGKGYNLENKCDNMAEFIDVENTRLSLFLIKSKSYLMSKKSFIKKYLTSKNFNNGSDGKGRKKIYKIPNIGYKTVTDMEKKLGIFDEQ